MHKRFQSGAKKRKEQKEKQKHTEKQRNTMTTVFAAHKVYFC
jgi:hypothetical protein